MEETQTDLLTDFVQEPWLIQASSGKRLANFLIDYLIFLVLMGGVGIVVALISPETLDTINTGGTGFNIIDRLVTMLLYATYMSCLEAITKGRSLGKIITSTRAVNEDGSVITSATAFKRGFSRIVPFEVLSAFGSPCYPWHDKWNHSFVIDLKKSPVL
ncbi:MAG: RDD family protein [Chitinophagaceae bacterium]